MPIGSAVPASPPQLPGMNSDTSAGLYDFQYREYSTRGRWPSPDPAGLAAVDPSNPQSWNRYGYVLNGPESSVYPFGLFTNGSQNGGNLGFLCNISADGVFTVQGTIGAPCYLFQPWLTLQNLACIISGACNFGGGGGSNRPPTNDGPPVLKHNPCASDVLSAAGVDAEEQIATAQAFIAVGKAAANTSNFSNPVLEFFGGMAGYGAAVNTNGPLDIKNQPGPGYHNDIGVKAGNVSYGITCPYGKAFCQFAAGAAQTVFQGSPDLRNGTLKTGFDTASDNLYIQQGQAIRAAGCSEGKIN
jgi:RHS repeat-associated protein